MYKFLLTLRYLRRRLIPIFALLAVMLCVAMLIIVLSIMGGFLEVLESSGRKIMGDVKIAFGTTGIPHYQDLITELEDLPEAEAAAATIKTFGLLKMPMGSVNVVEVIGIDPERYSRALRYEQTLVWDREKLAEHDLADRYPRNADPKALAMDWSDWPDDRDPPMVIGVELNPNNQRNSEGQYEFNWSWLRFPLTLNLMAVSEGDVVDRSIRRFEVVNEFHSGLFEIDSRRIYIPFDVAQRMLLMDAVPIYEDRLDPTSPVVGEVPARASEILIRARPGVSADELRAAVETTYANFAESHPDMPRNVYIDTWQQLMGETLTTIRNEKNLMAFLFGMISLVAVILILVIFYMIVLEKTRDIGVLRALGASRFGVGSIFLTYAGVVGSLGSAMGATIGVLFVIYINEIHAWLGRTFGIVIWDRRVYFFDEIPNQVDVREIAVIVAAAIVASVIGTIIPAIKAGRVDPVESLRYE